jgi:serine/threonine-protein kinase
MVRETLREISTPGELCGVLAEKAVPAADREAFLQRCREALHEVVSPPGHAETAWDEVFLDELKSTLARYLGPLSRVVVDRAARKASSREELYRLVAQDIDAETDRKAFLAARVSPPGSNS